MKFVLHPWQLFLLILAGWINRQQEVIDYLDQRSVGATGARNGPRH